MSGHAKITKGATAAFMVTALVAVPLVGSATAGASATVVQVKPTPNGEEHRPGAARRSKLIRTSEAYRDKLRGDEWVFTSTY